eukprot:2311926-Pleurochrysis_carterae.AAC.1
MPVGTYTVSIAKLGQLMRVALANEAAAARRRHPRGAGAGRVPDRGRVPPPSPVRGRAYGMPPRPHRL